MLVLGGEQIRSLVSVAELVDCLRQGFRESIISPMRNVVRIPGGEDRLLLSMPAFDARGGGVVKVVTVYPDNASRILPTIQAVIVVFSDTGTPSALLDGTAVTHLRTGAASALASHYLSCEDSSHLLIIGTGALAPSMAEAHCAVRPIRKISVYGRRVERALVAAAEIRLRVLPSIEVCVPHSLEATVAVADIVCCATSSSKPVLAGKLLKRGAFVDLVGSFSPTSREADDEVVLRSRIFVDTLEGALSEAGDLLDPLRRGVIARERIEGELADLASGRRQGRVHGDEIITFKSVGTAIEDFAASKFIVAAAHEQQL
jgi:alanine dehydrogenase